MKYILKLQIYCIHGGGWETLGEYTTNSTQEVDVIKRGVNTLLNDNNAFRLKITTK
jgi:hypothetical protein